MKKLQKVSGYKHMAEECHVMKCNDTYVKFEL